MVYIILIKIPVYITITQYNFIYKFAINSIALLEICNLWIYFKLLFNYSYQNNFDYNNLDINNNQEVVEKTFNKPIE
ncbi:hypothetical protein SCORR_v1c05890 [Spiroplasma corruscae]|uniref:Uncharacterized protein n=1 Tax=Spiroplasma corruscae TaxID=216934 RepID=A0A222EPS9_9MOLU|nr:hypothetical protein [Spiroplasma corruscae]ASP28361.1 hypothetical protein SCORR_v1c05890 [Spiroplasma corruscae]